MPKRTPLPCTADNCGDNFACCGIHGTYTNRKCRCDSCHKANAEYARRNYLENREAVTASQKQYREANRKQIAERKKQYAAENSEKIAEYQRRYRQENSETLAESKSRYYAENREQLNEYKKRYYAENREEHGERGRRYYEENREAVNEYKLRWAAENRETVRESQRRYHAKNRDAISQRNRQWRLDNLHSVREYARLKSHRRRAKMRASQIVEFTPEQLQQRMAYYGNRCWIQLPGVCTGGFDHVDHVKPIAKGGADMLANLRPACRPCNQSKSGKWPFKFAA